MASFSSFLSVDWRDRYLVAVAGLLSVAVVAAPVIMFGAAMTALTNTTERIGAIHRVHVDIDRYNADRLALVDDFANVTSEIAREYRAADDRESAAIERLRVRHYADSVVIVDGVAHAYRTMASTEGDALALALSGRFDDARQRLRQPAYRSAKSEFVDAMARSRADIATRLLDAQAHAAGAHGRARVFSIVASVLFLGLWAAVYRRFQARAESLRQARIKLESTAAEVRRREREAQSNLIANNPTPTVEFEFPPAAKLVAWLRSRGVEDLERWLKLYPGEIRKLAPHFRVARINAAAVTLIGADNAAQACDLARWLPDRSLHACALAILRALWSQSKSARFDIEVVNFSGALLTIRVSGLLAPRADRKGVALVCALQDTSEAATLRGELDAARGAVVEAERARGDFISSVSHDLRSPLNGVLGMASAMTRTPLDREQRGMLAVIADSGEVMRDALDRALDVSKLELGVLELDIAPYDVDTVARAVDARFSPQARAKNIRLRVHVEDAARRRVTGDETRTRQILSKLISNAIRCTQRGEVEARVDLESDAAEATFLTMTVRDTGAGMTASEIERATSTFGASSGGLSLCRRLCETMGGGLSVTSSTDYGTTIAARIKVTDVKVAPDAAPRISAAAEPSEALPNGLALLAADDNEINRIVLGDLLEQTSPDLTMVENGADALAAWRARAFDAVLLDVQMPLLDGKDVAREIRRIEAEEDRPRTPIIALSAGVMNDEIEACLEAGMDTHVAKPIDPDALFAALRDAVAMNATSAPDTDEDVKSA